MKNDIKLNTEEMIENEAIRDAVRGGIFAVYNAGMAADEEEIENALESITVAQRYLEELRDIFLKGVDALRQEGKVK